MPVTTCDAWLMAHRAGAQAGADAERVVGLGLGDGQLGVVASA
jgi:hypothetical protein